MYRLKHVWPVWDCPEFRPLARLSSQLADAAFSMRLTIWASNMEDGVQPRTPARATRGPVRVKSRPSIKELVMEQDKKETPYRGLEERMDEKKPADGLRARTSDRAIFE